MTAENLDSMSKMTPFISSMLFLVISLSSVPLPTLAQEASNSPMHAASAFEKLLQKVHQEMHGVALQEVALSRRLEEEGHEALTQWQKKAGSFVNTLASFEGEFGAVGGSTVLVLVIVLGIPIAIVFFSAFFFLNERSKENPHPPPRMFSSQSPRQDPRYSVMSGSSAGPRPQQLSYQRGSMGTAMESPMTTQQVISARQSMGGPSHSMGYAPGYSNGDDVLCPALIVPQREGVMLMINGAILPHQQEEVLEVNKLDHEQGVIVRVFISESGRDSGILLESVLRFPIAFVNTASAVSSKGLRPPTENRHVSISRASPIGGGEPNAAPFAIIANEGGQFVVRRGYEGGEVLHSVSMQGRSGQVVDAGGRKIATIDSPSGLGKSMTVHVSANVDAGMILCSVIAAAKLS